MVDLTADGEWLMTIGEDSYGYSAAFIYQKSKRTNMFSLFQEIHFGFISEVDHIKLAPQQWKRQIIRMYSTKTALAARID